DAEEGGVKVFKIKPAAEGALPQDLQEIVGENANENDLKTALASAIQTSTGEDFDANAVDLTAGDDSDIATEFNAGFEGGLQPVGFFDVNTPDDFDNRPSLTTADLLGRWTVSYEEVDEGEVEVSGIFFKDAGSLDTAETLVGSGFASVALDAQWNVVDRVFTVKNDEIDFGADCYLTERSENNSVLTLKCREQDDDNPELVLDNVLTLTKADDLEAALTADGGEWNEVFESRSYDNGEYVPSTVSFGPNNTLTIDDDGEVETGTYSLNGLELLIEIGDDLVTCYFAGRQAATAPNTVEGVFLRCAEEGDDIGEDVLLTKEDVATPLANTNQL
ncbi:MAG: hypothetical protein C0509_05600, partial [Acinetobacter sp.]|nr:hypothetical protein [Acinetobacter sp.]